MLPQKVASGVGTPDSDGARLQSETAFWVVHHSDQGVQYASKEYMER